MALNKAKQQIFIHTKFFSLQDIHSGEKKSKNLLRTTIYVYIKVCQMVVRAFVFT